MLNVLIYTTTAFAKSETFIYNQTKNKQVRFFIVAEKIDNVNTFPISTLAVKISPIPVNIFDRAISFFQRKIHGEKEFSLSFANKNFLKHFIQKNRIDLVHVNYGFNAIKVLPVLSKLKIPFIVHFHGFDASQLLKNPEYVRGLKKVMEKATQVIVVSKLMKEELSVKVGFGEKFKLIPYGVDLSLFCGKSIEKSQVINILHVGRLTPKKGVIDLVRSFNSLLSETPELKIILDIVGEGEESVVIRKLIEELKLMGKVILHGAKSQDEVVEFMLKSHIFVLNSRTADNGDSEGFPNVILEAMAAKCSIISTNHAGIPEAITNNKEGILVAEKDNESLKDALRTLYNNKELRLEYAKSAFNKVNIEYSLEQMLLEYSHLYFKSVGDFK